MNAYRASPIKPAVDHVEFALRQLVLAVHHVEAHGFALEVEDIVADLDQLATDIELIATGNASPSDLREAIPAHEFQAAIAYRAECARRQGPAPFERQSKRRRAA